MPRACCALAALVLVCIPLTPAHAQQPQPPRVREHLVVTAGRAEEPVGTTGAAISVLTREDLEASGAVWLRDALAEVPGLTVASSGGPGRATSVFLRGANSNQTLVLIDGVKVNTPGTGAFDLGAIPTAIVERVEVLRGPQSVLYGSEAIGGVVHVITRRGGGPALEASLSRGSFSTTDAALVAAATGGAWHGSLAAQLHDSEGFSAADEAAGNSEPDPFDARSLAGRAGWQKGRAHARLLLSLIDADAAIDGFAFGTGPVDDPFQEQSTRVLDLAARAGWGAERWDAELTLSRSAQRLRTASPGSPSPSAFELESELVEVDVQNLFALDSGTALAGVEHRREEALTLSRSAFGVAGYDRDTRTTGIYARYAHALANGWHASLGGRIEEHSRFGSESTFRASLAGPLAAGVRLHGSVGSGFRAPSLNELFFPFFGNPDLAPETSTGWDAGIELELAARRLVIDVTGFHNRFRELIQFAGAGFANVGRARSRGLEVETRWRPARAWQLKAAYTLSDALDEDSGLPLLRRPRHRGSLRASWQGPSGARVSAMLEAVGRRDDFGGLGRATLPGHARVDLALGQPLRSGLELDARIENLLDASYQEVFGYGTAGRSAYLGLRWSWSGDQAP